ncbi:MAG: hypothetical protein F6J92_29470 [Symploca sp. SIO1A3]|nr:hypothetical protein [Symploca sp. SIO1A3]
MAGENLKQAAQRRKAQKEAAKPKATTRKSRTTKTTKTSKPTETQAPLATQTKNKSGLSVTNTSNSLISGYTEITPTVVNELIPQFDGSRYQVDDPLNPPESIPQASEAQHTKGNRIYQGANRALDLEGQQIDLASKRLTVETKKANAYTTLMNMGQAFQKAKGSELDYLSQVETTQQKQTKLDVERLRTAHVASVAIETENELDETLSTSKIKAQIASARRQSAQTKLDELRKELED